MEDQTAWALMVVWEGSGVVMAAIRFEEEYGRPPLGRECYKILLLGVVQPLVEILDGIQDVWRAYRG